MEENSEPPQPNYAPYFERREERPEWQVIFELGVYLDSISKDPEYLPSKSEDKWGCDILWRAEINCPVAQMWIVSFTNPQEHGLRPIKEWRRFITVLGAHLQGPVEVPALLS